MVPYHRPDIKSENTQTGTKYHAQIGCFWSLTAVSGHFEPDRRVVVRFGPFSHARELVALAHHDTPELQHRRVGAQHVRLNARHARHLVEITRHVQHLEQTAL